MWQRWLRTVSLAPFVAAAALTPLHPQTPAQLPPDASPAEEAFVHTPAGFAREGRPAVAADARAGTVRLTVVDEETGRPTLCRVNVVGADGNYYEPQDHPLVRWSLHRTGNRAGKGPIRYYGWFFYCSGEATVRVPAGPVRVEVGKGYEFRPVTASANVPAGATRDLTVRLRRALPAAPHGYYSGDTHVHLPRVTAADDERALDLLEAEDVRFGYLLCMNDPRGYTGGMARQEWPQDRGFGPTSIKRRGDTTIASGQEYRCNTYGHICLLMHDRLVQHGRTVDPNDWPVFGLIGREARELGGRSFHAHGGYAREIYADFPQRATDGVELLQFAEYRGIGLRGWYRILNVGYRFPALGASDYPYCRALADCRTYVHSPEGPPDAQSWVRLAAEGRSFFTTGPLLLLEVEGRRPGDRIALTGTGPHRLRARLRVASEVAAVAHAELIVNGRTASQFAVPPAGRTGAWHEWTETIELTEPAWVAARAYAAGPTGKADAEAHTNPVHVTVDGKAPYRQADLDWLLERVEEQIAAAEKRTFAEKPKVLEFFRQSRSELLRIRTAGGQ